MGRFFLDYLDGVDGFKAVKFSEVDLVSEVLNGFGWIEMLEI